MRIRATLPREQPGAGADPAGVSLRPAAQRVRGGARATASSGTDESSLVERLEQVEVSVVMGSDRNIKITKPGDMDLARFFLEQETAREARS